MNKQQLQQINLNNQLYFSNHIGDLISYLTSKNIPIIKVENDSIQTPTLKIEWDSIISMETGEIFIDVMNENDSILNYMEYIPAIISSQMYEEKERGGEQ